MSRHPRNDACLIAHLFPPLASLTHPPAKRAAEKTITTGQSRISSTPCSTPNLLARVRLAARPPMAFTSTTCAHIPSLSRAKMPTSSKLFLFPAATQLGRLPVAQNVTFVRINLTLRPNTEGALNSVFSDIEPSPPELGSTRILTTLGQDRVNEPSPGQRDGAGSGMP